MLEKRLVIAALAATVSTILLTACGSGQNSSGADNPDAPSDDRVQNKRFADGVPHSLPEKAGGYEIPFSPSYSYSSGGCFPTPAIDADGSLSVGLEPADEASANCADAPDLDNGQTYARTQCKGAGAPSCMQRTSRETKRMYTNTTGIM